MGVRRVCLFLIAYCDRCGAWGYWLIGRLVDLLLFVFGIILQFIDLLFVYCLGEFPHVV